MHKRILKISAVACVALAISMVLTKPYISHSESNDPLISLSYLNEIVLPQFKQDILAEIAKNPPLFDEENGSVTDDENSSETVEVMAPVEESDTDTNTDTESVPNSEQKNEQNTEQNTEQKTEPTGTYTLLELEYGKCIYTNSALEFIVRPGSDVTVISPFEQQGIADITNGIEYLNGETVIHNAYCLIPRGGDGRGIQVNNEKSYILVRGEYYIG